jgi:hypothetical protein
MKHVKRPGNANLEPPVGLGLGASRSEKRKLPELASHHSAKDRLVQVHRRDPESQMRVNAVIRPWFKDADPLPGRSDVISTSPKAPRRNKARRTDKELDEHAKVIASITSALGQTGISKANSEFARRLETKTCRTLPTDMEINDASAMAPRDLWLSAASSGSFRVIRKPFDNFPAANGGGLLFDLVVVHDASWSRAGEFAVVPRKRPTETVVVELLLKGLARDASSPQADVDSLRTPRAAD